MDYAPNIENSISNATTSEDFYNEIEPIEQPDSSEAVMAIQQLIRRIFEQKGNNGRELSRRFEIAFRRFVAIAYLVDQKVVADGKPALKVAEAIGISRAGLSKLILEWSDELLGGLKTAGMKSNQARAKYAQAQRGHEGYRGSKRSALITGTAKPDKVLERARQLLARNAMVDFVAGRAWDTRDRGALRDVGFIDGCDTLTAAGLTKLEELRQQARERERKRLARA